MIFAFTFTGITFLALPPAINIALSILLRIAFLLPVFGNNHCSKCSHQLTSKTYEQINAIEDLKLRVIEEKHKQDIEAIQEEMNQRFNLIKFIIQENYNLPHNRNSRRLLNY